jgi:periplasmic copper chaperone A
MRKTIIGAAGAVTAMLALPVAVQAHVTANPSTLPAEGYGKIDLSVGHGCEDSPTTSVTVQMPDEVQSATPQVVPGWKITTKEGKLAKPYDSDGEQVTDGVREITWSGGRLDPHQLEVFGLNVKVSGSAGDNIAFKTVQKCVKGANNWVEIPVEGEEEPPEPAPMVELLAAEDGQGASGSDAQEQGGQSEEVALQNTSAPTEADDDGASTMLVVIALVVGALGLATGLVALLTARRRPTA